MHDLEKIVYLDMQKTGSTRTVDFLNKCSTLQLQFFSAHFALTQEYSRPDAFFFTTVRNPFDLYVSSFRFGCDGPDSIRLWMEAHGVTWLYEPTNEAFNAWVEFISDPQHARAIGEGFELVSKFGVGIMSYRHLVYSIRHPSHRMLNIRSRAEFDETYEQENQMHQVIRSEELDDELQKLAREHFPQYFDQELVDIYFGRPRDINVTQTGKAEDFEFSPAMRELVREREQFLLQRYYPDEA